MTIPLTKRLARIFESHQAIAWATSLAVHALGAAALWWMAEGSHSHGDADRTLRLRLVLQAEVRGGAGEPVPPPMTAPLVPSVASAALDEPAPRPRTIPERHPHVSRPLPDRAATSPWLRAVSLPGDLHSPVPRPVPEPRLASPGRPARDGRPRDVVWAGLTGVEPAPDGRAIDPREGTRRTPPRLVQNRLPVYPELALRNGWQGTVVLRVRIDAAGSVTATELLTSSGHEVLDSAAIQAVRTWRYEPAWVSGRPVAVTIRQPVTFTFEGYGAGR